MDKKKVIGFVFTIVLTMNAVFAGAMCYCQCADAKQSEKVFEVLQERIEGTGSVESVMEESSELADPAEQKRLESYEKYQELYEENTDFVG